MNYNNNEYFNNSNDYRKPVPNVPFNNKHVYMENRCIIEMYKNGDLVSIIYPFKHNSILYTGNFVNDVQEILFKIIASDAEYSNNCVNDIKFVQNHKNNISVYIKNELVLNAMMLPVFTNNQDVYYRGYVFNGEYFANNKIHIYISKMDNPYNRLYELSVDSSSYQSFKEYTLDYIDNLMLR